MSRYFFLLGIISFLVFPSLVSAQSSFRLPPGYVKGENTTALSITDSEYLDITLTSNSEFSGVIGSIPSMIEIKLEQDSSVGTTTLTVEGLEPNTLYHRYTNGYRDHATTTANSEGVISFDADLSNDLYVVIQENESTLFISDDTTGGEGDEGENL